MQPTAMRLLGETAPALPKAEAGTIAGSAAAVRVMAVVCVRNSRRVERLVFILNLCCRLAFEIPDSGHHDASMARNCNGRKLKISNGSVTAGGSGGARTFLSAAMWCTRNGQQIRAVLAFGSCCGQECPRSARLPD